MKTKYVAFISLFVIFSLTSLIGFHCSKGFVGVIEEKSTPVVVKEDSPDPDFNSLVDLPIGLMTPTEVFNSMRQSTQVSAPNSATINEFLTRQGTFPTDGQLYKVNAPMLLSLTNLSSQFCQQMITNEMAIAATQRTFTNQINYNDTPANLQTAQINDVVRRLARSAWGRNETPAELNIINSGMQEIISDLTSAEKTNSAFTRNLALVLCSTVLSAIDTVSL